MWEFELLGLSLPLSLSLCICCLSAHKLPCFFTHYTRSSLDPTIAKPNNSSAPHTAGPVNWLPTQIDSLGPHSCKNEVVWPGSSPRLITGQPAVARGPSSQSQGWSTQMGILRAVTGCFPSPQACSSGYAFHRGLLLVL